MRIRKKRTKEPVRNRDSQIHIRLTKEEIVELKEAAARADLSVADFIMSAARNETVISLEGGIDLYNELRRQGINLNQLVRAMYGAGVRRSEIDSAIQGCMDLQNQFKEFIADNQIVINSIKEKKDVIQHDKAQQSDSEQGFEVHIPEEKNSSNQAD